MTVTAPEQLPQQPAHAMPASPQPSRRRRTALVITAVAVVIAALAVAGALSGEEDKTRPAAASASPSPTASAPAPSPSAATAAPYAPGQTFTFDSSVMTTTVLQYKQPIGEHGPRLPQGETVGGIEVQTCRAANADGPVEVGSAAWSLSWADGTTATQQWPGVVSAEYPYEARTLMPGKCVKGWIVFTVPEKGKPDTAVYEGRGNQGRPAEWKLG